MSATLKTVGIALGSNLGNRLRHLQEARDMLKKLAAPGTFRQAAIYQTEPVACPPDSPDFYNTVVEIGYAGTAHDLLDATQAIEFHLGRVSSPERKALVNAYAIGLERNPLAGIEAALKRSTVPARVVWGTGDPIFSAASPDYLDRTLGNSRGVRRVPGAKLFFPEEFPDLIAEEARQLWGVTATEAAPR